MTEAGNVSFMAALAVAAMIATLPFLFAAAVAFTISLFNLLAAFTTGLLSASFYGLCSTVAFGISLCALLTYRSVRQCS